MWAYRDWIGSLYPRGARSGELLRHYAAVFTTVEGNTTFYRVPEAETVLRWRSAVPASFRFCFKLPRTVTHERLLAGADDEAAAFLRRMAPLGERLGPYVIQLPPAFGPERLDRLAAFAERLAVRPLAVELRHPAFFASAEATAAVDRRLAGLGCERVVMDTRALRAGDADHLDVRAARHQKPKLPTRPVALGRHPVVRFIGHPEPAVNEPWLAEWAERVAGWLGAGKEPFVMIHTPNNVHAPPLARRFHALLGAHADVGTRPPWPGEGAGEQLSLL